MLMRRLPDDVDSVMVVRSWHRRVDRMFRVLSTDGPACVRGQGRPDDYESECERQQASSHPVPQYTGFPATLMASKISVIIPGNRSCSSLSPPFTNTDPPYR
jgi:hypothetical protein